MAYLDVQPERPTAARRCCCTARTSAPRPGRAKSARSPPPATGWSRRTRSGSANRASGGLPVQLPAARQEHPRPLGQTRRDATGDRRAFDRRDARRPLRPALPKRGWAAGDGEPGRPGGLERQGSAAGLGRAMVSARPQDHRRVDPRLRDRDLLCRAMGAPLRRPRRDAGGALPRAGQGGGRLGLGAPLRHDRHAAGGLPLPADRRADASHDRPEGQHRHRQGPRAAGEARGARALSRTRPGNGEGDPRCEAGGIPELGHAPQMSEPDAFNRALVEGIGQ